MYKLNQNSTVTRLSDGACITLPANESEGWKYLQWLSAGNTPAPADLPDPRQAIYTQIAALEATITPRRLREALLTGDTAFIDSVDTQIATLRGDI